MGPPSSARLTPGQHFSEYALKLAAPTGLRFFDEGQGEFQTFARDHLSLMIYQVDAYAALPESEQKLALAMEEKYGVEQMPAIVVFSPDGRELLRTQGYRGTPAETIVAQLRALGTANGRK